MEARSVLAERILALNIVLVFVVELSPAAGLSNQSCYTCVEPLVGYTDHLDSCRSFNPASEMAMSYVKHCDEQGNHSGEYECRKLVISFRSVDIYLRRDCVPKGRCSWKDKSQSMMYTPVSDCVYTDDNEQKLECIYCCDTPMCNRAIACYGTNLLLLWFSLICALRNVL